MIEIIEGIFVCYSNEPQLSNNSKTIMVPNVETEIDLLHLCDLFYEVLRKKDPMDYILYSTNPQIIGTIILYFLIKNYIVLQIRNGNTPQQNLSDIFYKNLLKKGIYEFDIDIVKSIEKKMHEYH